MSDDFNFRAQNVNYLGFLEAQLRDLTGMATLAYEFIQNADDVRDEAGQPAATHIHFDFTDDALVIENDGEFRPIDFERLQTIASGGKRAEAGTIGAFGIGFLVVYQVTDRPEIYSGGRHWTIRPDVVDQERILERHMTTQGTRFVLPWAMDQASAIRRALRIPAWAHDAFDGLARETAKILPLAALFLNHLQKLTVSRNGEVLQSVVRTRASDQLYLDLQGQAPRRYQLLQGDFAEAARALKTTYKWQIEANRNAQIQVAIPLDEEHQPGRLFAGLPTEEHIPAQILVNADFYPTTDRRRLQFAAGYQAEWNEAALTATAALIAATIPALRQTLGALRLWTLLAQLQATAEQPEKTGVWKQFWQQLEPEIGQMAIFPDLHGVWGRGSERLLLRSVAARRAAKLLTELGLPVVDPLLSDHLTLMRRPEMGSRLLTLADLLGALRIQNLGRPQLLSSAPPPLREFAAWQLLWPLLNELLVDIFRPDERAEALDALRGLAIVITERMRLSPLGQTFRGNAEVQRLFPDVNWLHPEIQAETFPGNQVPEFRARQAITYLRSLTVDELEAAWRSGRLDIEQLFRWFERQQIEILVDDPELVTLLRRLSLVPIDGQLRPLDALYIPGGFDDPLGLAAIVDLHWFGGRRQFLQDLGARELDFESYLFDLLPRALQQKRHLPIDGRHQLLALLAQRLGSYQDDVELRTAMARLPLIPALDGTFRAANEVYLDRQVGSLLGDGVAVAEPAATAAIAALYDWLGVLVEPTVEHLLEALKSAWPDLALGQHIWRTLARRLAADSTVASQLTTLTGPLIPVAGGHWRRIDEVVLQDDEAVAAGFTGLTGRLLIGEDELMAVWAAAGVQPLSALVHRQAIIEEPIGRPDLADHLQARMPLILKLAGTGALPVWNRKLKVLQQKELFVRPVLWLGDERFLGETKQMRAYLQPEEGELLVDGSSPARLWAAVGREIARHLQPEDPATLALGIREALAAASLAEAEITLTDLGFI